jgi:tetratricopeptide (TPR) repeat protein
LQNDPDNVSAHGNLGSLYVVTGDLDAARLSFMRATQSAAGKRAGPELMLGALDREADPSAAEGHFTAALNTLEQAHQSRQGTPFGRAEIQALALVALDRSAEAIAVFSSAASTRSGQNVFQRKDYELFGAPELAAGVNALLDIWRDIIAKDNSAAGPWGGPRRIPG